MSVETYQDGAWDLPENESRRGQILSSVAAALWQDQAPMRDDMIRMARIYDNLPVLGLSPRLYRVRQSAAGARRRVPLNCVKAVCDTYVSLVTEDMPKLTWQTDGLDWGLQRRARFCEQFVDGVFHVNDMQTVTAPQCVRDSTLFPFGAVKVSADERDPERPRVRIDRVLPWTLLADPDEAMNGRPNRIYEVSFVEKRALIDEYPEHRSEINSAGMDAFQDISAGLDSVNTDDFCAVVEGWSLPRYGKPGRWTQAVGSFVLDDREYRRRSFPHKLLYRQMPLQGIWGTPLAMDLAPIQAQISKLLVLIERSIFSVVGHWLVEANSNVNTNLIDNVVASMIKYTGTPPQYQAGRPLDSSVINHLNMLWSKAFEMTGVSEMAAGGNKPAGLNSGKAQLVYAETVSRRFTPCYRTYQEWFRSVAEEVVAVANDVYERHPDFAMKGASATTVQMIRWGDAMLEDDDFQLQLLPTNKLANDPAARLAEVENLIRAQMISPEDGRRLLDMPDLQSLYSLQDSAYNLVMSTVEGILERGEYMPPDPYFGIEQLRQAMQQMRLCYWKARIQRNTPPGAVDMMQRWIDQAAGMLEEQAAQQAPEGPVPGQGGPVQGTDMALEGGPPAQVQ